MKKDNILKKNTDFDRIIKTKKAYKYKDYIIYLEKNCDNSSYKFGLSVGKKVGNAVTRNKVKRQLKAIIDKNIYENNINCIIIVRKEILNKTFLEMEENLIKCFKDLNIIKENIDEK